MASEMGPVRVAGSKTGAAMMSVPMRPRMPRAESTMSRPRGVGCMLLPVRTNNGSSKKLRSLPSAALTAGWLRCSLSAASLTLRQSSRATST